MDKKLLIIATITFIFILAFGVVMFLLIQKNGECIQNPLIYGASKVIDEKGEPAQMICECEIGKNYFYFDRFGIYKENPYISDFNTNERGLIPWEQ